MLQLAAMVHKTNPCIKHDHRIKKLQQLQDLMLFFAYCCKVLSCVYCFCLTTWCKNLQDNFTQKLVPKIRDYQQYLVFLPRTMPDNIPAQPFCQIGTYSIKLLRCRHCIKCQFLHISFNKAILKTITRNTQSIIFLFIYSFVHSKCCLIYISSLRTVNQSTFLLKLSGYK